MRLCGLVFLIKHGLERDVVKRFQRGIDCNVKCAGSKENGRELRSGDFGGQMRYMQICNTSARLSDSDLHIFNGFWGFSCYQICTVCQCVCAAGSVWCCQDVAVLHIRYVSPYPDIFKASLTRTPAIVLIGVPSLLMSCRYPEINTPWAHVGLLSLPSQ